MNYVSFLELQSKDNLALQGIEPVGRSQTLQFYVGLGECGEPIDVIDQNWHETPPEPCFLGYVWSAPIDIGDQ